MKKKVIQKPGKYHSKSERMAIIEEYLSSSITKQEIWEKYTGKTSEHGSLLRWMRQLGYTEDRKMLIFAKETECMNPEIENEEFSNFEKLQLEKRISELEKQLKEAEMKAIAFSTMIDIAEKELKIPIRKKFNTKPSKPSED